MPDPVAAPAAPAPARRLIRLAPRSSLDYGYACKRACGHVGERVEVVLDIGSVKEFGASIRQIWMDGVDGVDVPRMALALAILVVALMLRRPVASLVLRLLRRGPQPHEPPPQPEGGLKTPARPLSAAGESDIAQGGAA